MRNEENRRYMKAGITAFSVILVSVLTAFVLFRGDEIGAAFTKLFRILTPFIYGAVIAYLLAPACNRLQSWFELLGTKLGHPERAKKWSNAAAILVCLALTLFAIWALIMMVIPEVANSVQGLIDNLPTRLEATNVWFHNVLENQPDLQKYWDIISNRLGDQLTKWLNTELLPRAQTLLGSVGSGVLNVAKALKNLVIGIIVAIYCLAERKKFLAQAKLVLYGIFRQDTADLIYDEVNYADMMFNGFISGKILDSFIIGVICFIGCSIMGFDSSLLIALIIGVTNVIPFFGPFIGAVPCSILLLLQNPLQCLYFIIFIIILQQVDGNIIGPKILGNTTGLSSFWVLFAILLFGGLWGPAGMVIGVPLWAVVYDILRQLLIVGLKRHGQYGRLVQYNRAFGAQPHPEAPHPAPAPRSRVSKKLQKQLKRLNHKQ